LIEGEDDGSPCLTETPAPVGTAGPADPHPP